MYCPLSHLPVVQFSLSGFLAMLIGNSEQYTPNLSQRYLGRQICLGYWQFGIISGNTPGWHAYITLFGEYLNNLVTSLQTL